MTGSSTQKLLEPKSYKKEDLMAYLDLKLLDLNKSKLSFSSQFISKKSFKKDLPLRHEMQFNDQLQLNINRFLNVLNNIKYWSASFNGQFLITQQVYYQTLLKTMF